MEKIIYTYALAKSLYDQGEDYIDAFWPLALRVFNIEKKYLSLISIQGLIKNDLELNIPLYSLETILKRAEKNGYLTKKHRHHFEITESGLRYLNNFKTNREVERKLNALFKDIKDFIKSKFNLEKEIKEIKISILELFNKNLILLVEYFSLNKESIPFTKTSNSSLENYLIEYIKIADIEKPEQYESLKDLALGSIISIIINSKTPEKIILASPRKYKDCTFFLDTNIIFSLMNLHEKELNEEATELINILKSYKCKLKIFTFTIQEICKVLQGYSYKSFLYSKTIEVDSIYYQMKKRGWDKTFLKDFIINIEEKLSNLGLEVELVENVNLNNYTPKKPEYLNQIINYKPEIGDLYLKHDLAAIDIIDKLRGGYPICKIEKIKYFFLTSDKGLVNFNLKKMGHERERTVGEVILDRVLSNILWLENPNANISLKSIIGAHSQGLFIQRGIWEKFSNILHQLKREGTVSDDKIASLFYHKYIEDVLRNIDESEVEKIDQNLVISEIEKANKLIEKAEKRKEEEFIKTLGKEISKKEIEMGKKWLERITEIKDNLRKSSKERSGKEIKILNIGIRISLVIMLLFFLYKNNFNISNLTNISNLNTILTYFFAILFLGINIGEKYNNLLEGIRKKREDKIYSKKINEAKLNENK
jgi:hypothetical protein